MTVGKKPITSSVFLILLSLSDRDRHGLGIADDVEERTGGSASLGAGTLYNAIRKMLDEGLIQESDSRPEPEDDDPRRRYYRITERGRKRLQAEAQRLERIVGMVREKAILDGANS